MEPELWGRILTEQGVLDRDLRDLQIVTGPDGPILYAVTGPNGGLSAFELVEGGLAQTAASSVHFTASEAGIRTGKLGLTATADGLRLMLASGPDGKLTGYDLLPDGSLDDCVQIALPDGAMALDGLVTARLSDGRQVYHVLDAGAGQLSTFVEEGAGVQQTSPPIQMDTQGGTCLLRVTAGGTDYVIVAGGSGTAPGQVASYGIDPDTGGLTAHDMVGAGDGLGLNAPATMAAVSVGGTAWIVIGDAVTNSLSVLQLDANGVLTATDYVTDTLHSRFGNVQALAMLETQGHVFVVAGGGDDGFSLFSLLPDGRLVHAATLIHDIGLGLEDVTALEMVRVGDELQIFAASEGAEGLSQFTVPLDDLGQVVNGMGTDGNDVILASAGGGTLTGGAGRDIFVLGSSESGHHILDFEPGRDQLDLGALPFLRSPAQLDHQVLADGILLQYGETEIRVTSTTGAPLALADLWPDGVFAYVDHYPVGQDSPGRTRILEGGEGADRIESTSANEMVSLGAGADVFVATLNMGSDTITDFDPHEDILDFSAFTAAEQAMIRSSQSGADRVLRMADGSTLTLQGIGPNAVPTGDVSIMGWIGRGQTLNAEASALGDADGVTELRYQWYCDGQEIFGATGSSYKLTTQDVGHRITVQVSYLDPLGSYEVVTSTPTGPVAEPRIETDADEFILGSAGDDFIFSKGGRDTVEGLAGDDTLLGGGEADHILGGDGDDGLVGLAKPDTLIGGAGADTLIGGTGKDLLDGGLGADDLKGGRDGDTIQAGKGDDTVLGGHGHDVMDGDGGHDSLVGGGGHDDIRGGMGNDTVVGGAGNDTLTGAEGNDDLSGGGRFDWISGGRGRDTLVGGGGNDTLKGDDHADRLVAGIGVDELWGGTGSDTIFGGIGDDLLRGEAGNDRLRGGAGNDRIFGGAGRDTLNGGAGDDLLYPGLGADVLAFSSGQDTVNGFSAVDDRLNLSRAAGIAGFTDLQENHLQNLDGGTLITDNVGNTMFLTNLLAEDLTADMFIF